MIERAESEVRMIPVDQITVLNPRARGKQKFKQIVDNIGRVGLKKPITVARHNGNLVETEYVLVCGQGRLEAFKTHGQTEIPAIIVNGTKEDFLLMSLAENLARRQHSPVELVKEIRSLKDRGYTFAQIAQKTDLSTAWVRGIIQLLDGGELRLVRAVERGQIPVSIAVTIARSDDKAVQEALREAYESNSLRGKQLLAARRLIENRKIKGKAGEILPRQSGSKLSRDELLRTYQRETQRQQIVIHKANLFETRLVFAVESVRRLLRDENFVTLLRAESLDVLPQYLAQQTSTAGAPQ